MNILVKTVAFTIQEKELNVFLMDERLPAKVPQKTLIETAQELVSELLGIVIEKEYIEQLYTFNEENSISVCYFVLIPETISSDQHNWVSLKQLPKFSAIDREIISYALKRLQWKLEYTNVAYSLLPEEFTLSELQAVYEIILGKELDKRNFRKKILSLGILKDCKKTTRGEHRPASLYRFKQRKPMIVEIL